MSVGTEGSGPNPRTYSRAEYAALEAENARLAEQVKLRETAIAAAEVERLKHSQQVLMQSRNAHRDERDALRAELAEVKGREAVAIKTRSAWDGLELLETLPDGTRLYTDPPASPDAAAATARAWELAAHLVKVLDLFDPNSRANVQTLVEAQAALLGGKP